MSKEHDLYKKAIKNMLPDAEEIKTKALAGENTKHKRIRRWLLPVAACILAVIAACASIPSVRAAVTQWFVTNRFTNYLAEPASIKSSAPEIYNLIQESKPETVAAANSIEIVNVVPKWQAWAAKLKPKVGNVIFDGKSVTVSFDMGGGAEELLMGSSNPIKVVMSNTGYIKLNGEKYAYPIHAHADASESKKQVTEEGRRELMNATSLMCNGSIDFSEVKTPLTEGFDKMTKKMQQETLDIIAKVQKRDPEYTPFDFKTLPAGTKLCGVQTVEANIELHSLDFSKHSEENKNGTKSEYIGSVKLRFSFDPKAGYESVTSYKINKSVEFKGKGTFAWKCKTADPKIVTCMNKTLDLTGVKMTAKRLDVYGTKDELYVSITCPKSWSKQDKECFLAHLTPETKGDGTVLNRSGEGEYGLEEKGEDMGICLYFSMLPSEVQNVHTFEIIPVLGRYAGYDGKVPYVEGKPTRLREDEITGWQEDSTELTDCALRFSLK